MSLLSNEPVFRSWNLNQVNIEINSYEVSKEVSFAGNNSAELIKPI